MPIFDQGYQHWSGELSGHGWRWLAIARNGVRTSLKSRMVRMMLFVAWSPAVALAFILSMWGLAERGSATIKQIVSLMWFLDPTIRQDPRHYRLLVWTMSYDYFLWNELWLSMILILLIGPNLISQDLRFNALPLYFSRPLRRIDYFLGKLGIIGAFLAMMVVIPAIVAYVLGLLFSLDISILGDTFRLLISSVVYGLIISLSAGLLVLALSALSRNSRYVALMWLGIWFLSSAAGGVLEESAQQQRRHVYFNSINAIERNRDRVRRSVAQLPNEQRLQSQAQQLARRNAYLEFREAESHAAIADFRPLLTYISSLFNIGRDFLLADARSMTLRSEENAWQKAEREFREADLHASMTDWRPMVSYTENLTRVGRELLGTDACWVTLSELEPPQMRDRFLLRHMGPQYPWYWSAGVLFGLFGLSAVILHFPIKTLDRLK